MGFMELEPVQFVLMSSSTMNFVNDTTNKRVQKHGKVSWWCGPCPTCHAALGPHGNVKVKLTSMRL